jgi:hypothetical protein
LRVYYGLDFFPFFWQVEQAEVSGTPCFSSIQTKTEARDCDISDFSNLRGFGENVLPLSSPLLTVTCVTITESKHCIIMS